MNLTFDPSKTENIAAAADAGDVGEAPEEVTKEAATGDGMDEKEEVKSK